MNYDDILPIKELNMNINNFNNIENIFLKMNIFYIHMKEKVKLKKDYM